MEIEQIEELKSDQDKDLCIQLTMEDIHRMERGIHKMEKSKDQAGDKKMLVKLFKERKTLEIFESIDESNLKMLYQCFKVLIYMIRIDRYRDNHGWLIDLLKELVQRYETLVVFMLNTVNGIDALKKMSQIEIEMTKEILLECMRIVEEDSEEEVLVGNLKILYVSLENKEIMQDNEFGEYDDIFAEHYFRYTVYKKVFSQVEKRMDLAELNEFYNLEEELATVQYSIEKNRVIESKRGQVLEILYERKNELQIELDTLVSNYQATRKEIRSSSEKESITIFLDKMEINCKDVFIEGRGERFLAKSCKIAEKEGTALEISRLVGFYQGIFESFGIVKDTEEAKEIQKIMNLWLNVKMMEIFQDSSQRQELVRNFLRLLPKCSDGSLDIRYRVNQEFLKEFIEYISV